MATADSALAMFKVDIQHEDMEVRLEAASRLGQICEVSGAERFEKEVLPVLKVHVLADHDEYDQLCVHVAMQLQACIPFFPTERLEALLDPLFSLSKMDETLVRQKAVEALKALIAKLDPSVALSTVVPSIQALVANDWFTGRWSAAGLFADAYARLRGDKSPAAGEARAALRKMWQAACDDETPMVKRHAARQIMAHAQTYEREFFMSDVVSLYATLATDENEYVRMEALDATLGLCGMMTPEERAEKVLFILKICAFDKSWKVRNWFARDLGGLAANFQHVISAADFLQYFKRFSRDPEAEVRASMTKCAPSFLASMGTAQAVDVVCLALTDCVQDTRVDVRVGAIEALLGICGGKDFTPAYAAQYVQPSMVLALKDEFPEVRLAVLSSLAKAAPLLGREKLDAAFVPILSELAGDRNWRVREAVLAQLPHMIQNVVSTPPPNPTPPFLLLPPSPLSWWGRCRV